jgi:hypothetical protein
MLVFSFFDVTLKTVDKDKGKMIEFTSLFPVAKAIPELKLFYNDQ